MVVVTMGDLSEATATRGGLFSWPEVHMRPPWLRKVKYGIGVCICQYESTALVVDDPSIVPKISELSWPKPDVSTRENLARLSLALFCSTWTAAHLLRPWIRHAWRWRRAPQ